MSTERPPDEDRFDDVFLSALGESDAPTGLSRADLAEGASLELVDTWVSSAVRRGLVTTVGDNVVLADAGRQRVARMREESRIDVWLD